MGHRRPSNTHCVPAYRLIGRLQVAVKTIKADQVTESVVDDLKKEVCRMYNDCELRARYSPSFPSGRHPVPAPAPERRPVHWGMHEAAQRLHRHRMV